MPCPSLTTSDEEIARNPHRPNGLLRRFAPCAGMAGCRRHWPGFVVPAPRRWGSIDFVAAPRNRRPAEGRWSRQAPHPKGAAWARIRTNVARNGGNRGLSVGPLR